MLLTLVLGLSLGLALARGLQLELGARVASGRYATFTPGENDEHLMRGLRELWVLGGWRLCVILLLTMHFPRWLRHEIENSSGVPAPAARGLDLLSTWRTLVAWAQRARARGGRELASAFFVARIAWLAAWIGAHAATLVSLSSPPITAARAPLILGVIADAALVHAALLGLLLLHRAREVSDGSRIRSGLTAITGRE